MRKKLTIYHALVMIVGSMAVLLNLAAWGNLLLTIIALACSTLAGWSVWLLRRGEEEEPK
jgi:hypothetical protein